MVVLILAVLVVAGAMWYKKRSGEQAANLAAINQALDSQKPVVLPAELKIDDQFPGPLVFVSSVKLPEGGWVAIHRDEAGAPGAIVGAGYFDKDLSSGEVNLSAASKEGETYHAVLYHDNGDLNFDTKTDLVYRDAAGLPMIINFRVTKNLPENKG